VYVGGVALGVGALPAVGDLAVGIAREVRDGWSGRDAPFLDIQRHKGEMLERRLAIAIGWAADRMGSRILLDGFAEEGGALAADGPPAEVMASDIVQEAYMGRELADV